MAVPPEAGSPPSERNLESIIDKPIDIKDGKTLTFSKDDKSFIDEYKNGHKISFEVNDTGTSRKLYISFPPGLPILEDLTEPSQIKAAILPLLLSIPKIEEVFNGTIKKIQGHMEGGQFKSFKSFKTEEGGEEGVAIEADAEYNKRFSYLNKILTSKEEEATEDELPEYVKNMYETARKVAGIGVGVLGGE